MFDPAEQPGLVRRLTGGGYAIVVGGVRYTIPADSPLLLVKIWHVYERAATGINTVELLGDLFIGWLSDRLTAPVEVCLPVPRSADPERLGLAVKGRLDPAWTILATTLKDGQVCAETTRVAWLTLVEAPKDEAA
ncbi:MAG: hypothetical protein OXG27_08970 [Chloroflexi bacterium]|nr:hypothetical protein [Chloroflexota bacterium]